MAYTEQEKVDEQKRNALLQERINPQGQGEKGIAAIKSFFTPSATVEAPASNEPLNITPPTVKSGTRKAVPALAAPPKQIALAEPVAAPSTGEGVSVPARYQYPADQLQTMRHTFTTDDIEGGGALDVGTINPEMARMSSAMNMKSKPTGQPLYFNGIDMQKLVSGIIDKYTGKSSFGTYSDENRAIIANTAAGNARAVEEAGGIERVALNDAILSKSSARNVAPITTIDAKGNTTFRPADTQQNYFGQKDAQDYANSPQAKLDNIEGQIRNTQNELRILEGHVGVNPKNDVAKTLYAAKLAALDGLTKDYIGLIGKPQTIELAQSAENRAGIEQRRAGDIAEKRLALEAEGLPIERAGKIIDMTRKAKETGALPGTIDEVMKMEAAKHPTEKQTLSIGDILKASMEPVMDATGSTKMGEQLNTATFNKLAQQLGLFPKGTAGSRDTTSLKEYYKTVEDWRRNPNNKSPFPNKEVYNIVKKRGWTDQEIAEAGGSVEAGAKQSAPSWEVFREKVKASGSKMTDAQLRQYYKENYGG